MNKYKEVRGKHSQEAAAAKTGISVASARRLHSTLAYVSPMRFEEDWLAAQPRQASA